MNIFVPQVWNKQRKRNLFIPHHRHLSAFYPKKCLLWCSAKPTTFRSLTGVLYHCFLTMGFKQNLWRYIFSTSFFADLPVVAAVLAVEGCWCKCYYWHPYTVKRVDEVVRHPHLVTQDQFTQVSKVSDIPAENFTINIELFRQTFTNVELLRQSWKVSKAALLGREPRFSGLQSDTLPLRHTSICLPLKVLANINKKKVQTL